MDSATEFLLGSSVHSLATPFLLPGGVKPATMHTTGLNRFSEAFQSALEQIAMRARQKMPWQLLELFGDPTKKEMKWIYEFLDPIIEAEMEKSKGTEAGGKGDDHETLLSMLVAETDGEHAPETGCMRLRRSATTPSDRQIIRDELLNILVAGRDTVSLKVDCNGAPDAKPYIL